MKTFGVSGGGLKIENLGQKNIEVWRLVLILEDWFDSEVLNNEELWHSSKYYPHYLLKEDKTGLVSLE